MSTIPTKNRFPLPYDFALQNATPCSYKIYIHQNSPLSGSTLTPRSEQNPRLPPPALIAKYAWRNAVFVENIL
jgi:hypothetical protein